MTEYNEYFETGGGKWFYTQNKPGTKWFDTVDNSNMLSTASLGI